MVLYTKCVFRQATLNGNKIKDCHQTGGNATSIHRKSLMYNNFTLIELLVVIGIIVLLLSLLLPALQNAKNQSYSLSCLNNLKQHGTSIALYVTDNNDWLPIAIGYRGHITGEVWFDLLNQYYQKPVLYSCPGNQNQPDLETWAGSYGVVFANAHKGWHIGYNYPSYLGYNNINTGAVIYPGARLTSCPKPSIFVDMHDGVQCSNGPLFTDNGYFDFRSGLCHCHKGDNFLFLDSHARWASIGQAPIEGWRLANFYWGE